MELNKTWNSTANVTSYLGSTFNTSLTRQASDHYPVYWIVMALLIVFVIPVTSLLTIAILSSREMRNNVRHLVFVSVNVTQFLLAGIYFPTIVSLRFKSLKPYICLYLQLIIAYGSDISVFVTCWSLVVLHLQFVASIFFHRLPLLLSPLKTCILRVLVSASPWLFMFLIIPGLLWQYDRDSRSVYRDRNSTINCFIWIYSDWQRKQMQTLSVLSPLAISSSLSIISIVVYILRKRGILRNHFQLMSQPSPQQGTPLVPILATIVASICLLPNSVHFMARHLLYDLFDSNHFYLASVVYTYLMTLKIVNSLALTLTWLADSSLRTRLKVLLCRCKRTRSNSTAEIRITYKDFVASDQESVSESHPP